MAPVGMVGVLGWFSPEVGVISLVAFLVLSVTLVALCAKCNSMLMEEEEEEEEDPMERLPHSRETCPTSILQAPHGETTKTCLHTHSRHRGRKQQQIKRSVILLNPNHTPQKTGAPKNPEEGRIIHNIPLQRNPFPTLDHIPNAQMDGKRRGRVGGTVGSVLCQLELPSIL